VKDVFSDMKVLLLLLLVVLLVLVSTAPANEPAWVSRAAGVLRKVFW
jgi:hypothetical protein